MIFLKLVRTSDQGYELSVPASIRTRKAITVNSFQVVTIDKDGQVEYIVATKLKVGDVIVDTRLFSRRSRGSGGLANDYWKVLEVYPLEEQHDERRS